MGEYMGSVFLPLIKFGRSLCIKLVRMFSKSCAILLLSAAACSALNTEDVSLSEDQSDPRVFFANYTSSLLAVNTTILAYAGIIVAAGVVVGLVLYFIATNPSRDTTAAVPTTATTTASPGCFTTPPASWEISTCWALSPRGSRSTKSSTKRKNEFEENKIICPFLSDVKKKIKNCKIFPKKKKKKKKNYKKKKKKKKKKK